MKTDAHATTILKIREVIKDIRMDARTEKVLRLVLKRIVSCMEIVTDSRAENAITYPLPYILLLSFLSVLSEAETWADMEVFSEAYKTKLNGILPKYKGIGVPSRDTFRRVFGLISPEELQQSTTQFLVQEINQMKKALGINDSGLRHISVDGKEQRGTGRKYGTAEKVSNLQTLHCYGVTNGICPASIPISEKTNEIPTAQNMLKSMTLKDCVVYLGGTKQLKEGTSVNRKLPFYMLHFTALPST